MGFNDDSRDYNVKELRDLDDERFVVTFKEAMFAECIFFATIFLVILVSYGLCPKDINLITYVMGFPTWFVAAIGVVIVVWGFVLFHCAKLSKDFPLDAKIEEKSVKEDV